MEAFKEKFNKASILKIGKEIQNQDPNFKLEAFIKNSTVDLKNLEMKQRVEQISLQINEHLQGSFKKKTSILIKTLKSNKNPNGLEGFLIWPLTYFIEVNGLDDFDTSINALKKMTKLFTSEFSIRPFLSKDDQKVFLYLKSWISDDCHHVRRLVSEGTRPNLPWGKNVTQINNNLKRNISLIRPLLTDPSEYVRKSVGNHLNDIIQKEPDIVFNLLEKSLAKDQSSTMRQLIRRTTRNLLKSGHPRALLVNGYDPKHPFEVLIPKMSTTKIKKSEGLKLPIIIKNKDKKEHNYYVSYILEYKGPEKRKLYQKSFLKSLKVKKQSQTHLEKLITFKNTSNRIYPGGRYEMTPIVNSKIVTTFLLDIS